MCHIQWSRPCRSNEEIIFRNSLKALIQTSLYDTLVNPSSIESISCCYISSKYLQCDFTLQMFNALIADFTWIKIQAFQVRQTCPRQVAHKLLKCTSQYAAWRNCTDTTNWIGLSNCMEFHPLKLHMVASLTQAAMHKLYKQKHFSYYYS